MLINTFFAPEQPEAHTMIPLMAVLKTGVVPSGIASPVRKQDNKQRGPIILCIIEIYYFSWFFLNRYETCYLPNKLVNLIFLLTHI